MNRILIVDDDVRLLKTLRGMLEASGPCEVMTQDSARRALAEAPAFKPDIIILDMNMPGMGGLEFLKQIMGPDGKPAYPVLVLTSRSQMAEFFDSVPVSGFMAKPFDLDALKEKIDLILRQRPGAVAAPAAARRSSVSAERLLIAEDAPEFAAKLIAAAEAAGYNAETVSAGPDVFRSVVSSKPGAILLKLILRGLNGDAVARMLMSIPDAAGIPVVLYTSSKTVTDEDRLRSAGSGVSTFLKSDDAPAIVAAAIDLLEQA